VTGQLQGELSESEGRGSLLPATCTVPVLSLYLSHWLGADIFLGLFLYDS